MNDIELKIKEALSQDIELPYKYKYIIRNTLKDKKVTKEFRRNRVIRILATCCACVIVSTSIIYAKDISNFFYNFFNRNNGINTAMEHGYFDEPNTEYVNSENVSTNNSKILNATNTEIKVENMLMDDYSLSFTFSIKLDESIDVSKIQNVNFPNMIITDENNKILYCDSKEIFNKYCNEKNLNYEYLNFNENYINNETNYFIKSKDPNTNTIELIYNLNASIYPYPKSTKLYIDITQINISESEKSDKEETILNGSWNIDFDVDEKFYNREAIVYQLTNCNYPNINITEACLYNTGMVFEFTSQEKPIWNQDDSVEVQRQKLKEFADNNIVHYVTYEYVENSKGERFNPVIGNSESSGTMYEASGNFKHWQTFDLTKYDATDKLTIYMEVYLQGDFRDITIELQRKN